MHTEVLKGMIWHIYQIPPCDAGYWILGPYTALGLLTTSIHLHEMIYVNPHVIYKCCLSMWMSPSPVIYAEVLPDDVVVIPRTRALVTLLKHCPEDVMDELSICYTVLEHLCIDCFIGVTGGLYWCHWRALLVSLEGFIGVTGGLYWCHWRALLVSLEGFIGVTGGLYWCHWRALLVSLEGFIGVTGGIEGRQTFVCIQLFMQKTEW